MPEEEKKPLISKEMRGFLLKLGLGLAAIGGGAWAISEWLKQPWRSWEEGYLAVLQTKVKLYDQWITEGEGSLTDEQREMLQNLMEQEEYYQKNPPPGASLPDVTSTVQNIVFTVLGGYFAYELWNTIIKPWIKRKIEGGEVKTEYSLTYIAFSCINYAHYLEGRQTLAVNAQTWLQNFFQDYDMPRMQLVINTMQAQLPYLSGWKLAYWSSLIPAYQFELTYTVPTIVQTPLWTVLPPPPV